MHWCRMLGSYPGGASEVKFGTGGYYALAYL